MKYSNISPLSIAFTTAVMMAAASAGAATERYKGAMKDIPHFNVEFSQGSSVLSASDKANVRELIQGVLSKGEIELVTVAAWSDKSMPKKGGKLSDSDRALAKARADAVTDFIKDQKEYIAVDSYSMAENSNWLANLFSTPESELKAVFERKVAVSPVTNAEFQVIKNEGKPSEAVVVIQRKQAM